jgi:hypothetical protein
VNNKEQTMNERILVLAASHFPRDGEGNIHATPEIIGEFAELIVRESIVDFYRNYLDTTSDDDITEQVDRYVKQNFGVGS